MFYARIFRMHHCSRFLNELSFASIFVHGMIDLLSKISAMSDLQEAVLQPNMVLSPKISLNTASQFEAMVLQSTLKNRCIDQHFLDEPTALPAVIDEPTSVSWNISAPLLNGAVGRQSNVHAIEKRGALDPSPLDKFIQSAWGYAKQAANRLGLDPKLLMAQAALETGWGQWIAKDASGISSNNLFNIKAHIGGEASLVHISTTEYVDEMPIRMMASFKTYPSIEHSFNDYVALIQGSPRYKIALANTHHPKDYMDALHQAGYATDPSYAAKIWSIYQGQALDLALKRNECA